MGTITKRETGYLARVRRKGHILSRTFDGRPEAKIWIGQVEAAIDSGYYRDDTQARNTKFGDLLKDYREKVTVRKKGAQREALKVRRLERQPFAKLQLSELRARHFIQFRDDRLASGRTPATVRGDLAILSSIINHARKEWQISLPENPLSLVKKPSVRNARTRILKGQEETCLLRAIEPRGQDGNKKPIGPELRWLFILAVETGMRRGELLGLDWADVHIKESWVTARDTKNGDDRDIPLTPAATEVFREIRGDEINKKGRVFNLTGNAVTWRWRYALERAQALYIEDCEKTEIKPDPSFLQDLRWHDLRHVAITRLAEIVPDTLELSRITGHKTLAMLRRYYNPHAKDLAVRLAQRIAARAS
ncbi:site-specific integrase [Pollutimonas sp. H1-120]|uniref:tyrosine-type recombinase/integrase n=1 Tax=Pollutimonas sp. H1-120 TaxID=3148824 RepID=UPI003B521B98